MSSGVWVWELLEVTDADLASIETETDTETLLALAYRMGQWRGSHIEAWQQRGGLDVGPVYEDEQVAFDNKVLARIEARLDFIRRAEDTVTRLGGEPSE